MKRVKRERKTNMLCLVMCLLLCLSGCGNAAQAEQEQDEPTQSETTQAVLLPDGQAADAIEPEEPDAEATAYASLYEDVEQEETERTVLTVGTLSQFGSLESLVSKFNATSEDYVAEIEIYDSLTVLNTKLLSGDGPDVLFLDEIPYVKYINRGVLLDVSEVLDGADEYEPALRELTQAQFSDCIAVVSYSLDCIAAPEYVTEGCTEWTFDTFTELVSGTNAFEKYTKEECLMLYCMSNLDDYIDTVQNTCSFDSEEFYAALEFLNSFLDDEAQIVGDGKASEVNFTQEILSVSDLDTSTYAALFWDGAPVTFFGYPSQEDSGLRFTPYLAFGVPYSASQVDGAEEFLAYALSEEYQSQMSMGLPVLHDVLMDEIASAYGSSGDETEKAGEMAQRMEDLLDRTTAIAYVDATVYEIVTEEVASYFSGIRTAEETASLIQSRVQLYLDEQA